MFHFNLYVNIFLVLKPWKHQLGVAEVVYDSNRWQPFFKMAAMVMKMLICNGPISICFLNLLSMDVPNLVLLLHNEQLVSYAAPLEGQVNISLAPAVRTCQLLTRDDGTHPARDNVRTEEKRQVSV